MQTVLRGFSDVACVDALSIVSDSAPSGAHLFVSEAFVAELGRADGTTGWVRILTDR